MSNEHSLAILETVDNDCSSIAEFDLEDGFFVLVPPFLFAVSRLPQIEMSMSLTSQTVA